MPLDSLIGIVRTGGIKFARASEKWSEKNLIAAQESKQQPDARRFCVLAYAVDFSLAVACGSNFTNSSLSVEKFAVATVVRG